MHLLHDAFVVSRQLRNWLIFKLGPKSKKYPNPKGCFIGLPSGLG